MLPPTEIVHPFHVLAADLKEMIERAPEEAVPEGRPFGANTASLLNNPKQGTSRISMPMLPAKPTIRSPIAVTFDVGINQRQKDLEGVEVSLVASSKEK